MAFHAMKTSALAVGLFLGAVAAQAQTEGDGLPRRPAPVSGRVSADHGVAPLHPAANPHLLPVVSTARQVPPPPNPDEPLLKPEASGQAAPDEASPASAPPATAGSPRRERTVGHKVPQRVEGRDKAQRVVGRPHEDRHPAGHRKRAERSASSRPVPAVAGTHRPVHARFAARSTDHRSTHHRSADQPAQKIAPRHRPQHGRRASILASSRPQPTGAARPGHPSTAHHARSRGGKPSALARASRSRHAQPAHRVAASKPNGHRQGHEARHHSRRTAGARGSQRAPARAVPRAASGV